jgi:hypothetical protein
MQGDIVDEYGPAEFAAPNILMFDPAVKTPPLAGD